MQRVTKILIKRYEAMYGRKLTAHEIDSMKQLAADGMLGIPTTRQVRIAAAKAANASHPA